MNTISLKSMSPDTRHYIKEQVIRLHQEGKTGKEISSILNISNYAVSRIISGFRKKGADILNERKRGRKQGEKRILAPAEEEETQNIVKTSTPIKENIATTLWSLGAVQQLIRNKFHKEISIRAVCNYMHRWGMSCQRPKKKTTRNQKKW